MFLAADTFQQLHAMQNPTWMNLRTKEKTPEYEHAIDVLLLIHTEN